MACTPRSACKERLNNPNTSHPCSEVPRINGTHCKLANCTRFADAGNSEGGGRGEIKPGGARSPGSTRRFSGYCYCCGASLPVIKVSKAVNRPPSARVIPFSVTFAASPLPISGLFRETWPQGRTWSLLVFDDYCSSCLFLLFYPNTGLYKAGIVPVGWQSKKSK